MGILISDTAWSTPQEDHTPTCLIDDVVVLRG